MADMSKKMVNKRPEVTVEPELDLTPGQKKQHDQSVLKDIRLHELLKAKFVTPVGINLVGYAPRNNSQRAFFAPEHNGVYVIGEGQGLLFVSMSNCSFIEFKPEAVEDTDASKAKGEAE